jgi:aminopeptidase-like protein
MEKIYFGICDYCDEPGVLIYPALEDGEVDFNNCGSHSKEVCSLMFSLDIEYVEEGLYGFYDGTKEKLRDELENLGFIHSQEVEDEAIASFRDSNG